MSVVLDDVFAGIFVSVPPGHVATIYDRGRGVLKKILRPGLHFKLPIWQKAKLFNVQTLEYTIRRGDSENTKKSLLDEEPVIATTADGVKIEVEGTVLFRLDENRIPEIWQTIGEDFLEKVVKPVTRNRIGSGIGTFKSSDLFSLNRNIVEETIQKRLFEAFMARGIILEDFLLGGVVLSSDRQKEDKYPEQKEIKESTSKEKIEGILEN